MTEKCECACSAAPKLIFACSGAADVGAVADQAARKLTRDGKGKMFCMAGIGGRISGIMKTTEAAEMILAIDGCALDMTILSWGMADWEKTGRIAPDLLDARSDRRHQGLLAG